MPDEFFDPVRERKLTAVAEVGNFVDDVAGSGLPAHVLDRYRRRGYEAGWRVPVTFSDGVDRELHILLDGDFPYTAPRVAVADGPGVLAWPHLETEGFLCILPSDAAVSSDNPAGLVECVLGEACRLIQDSLNGSNFEDFRHEFLSYWGLAIDVSSPRFISLLEPEGPGRRVSVWRSRQVRVVGENPHDLHRWLPRWGAGKGKGQDHTLYDGVLVWLSKPLRPEEYPSTAADVRILAREQSPEALSALEELAAAAAAEIDVVLGAPTPNGVCFAAVSLRPLSQAGKHTKNFIVKGFRQGQVPRSLLIERYLSGGTKVTKSGVDRADHFWIHGRDRDLRQKQLRCRRVAVLGCGSVGGPLARLLAQAGVGNLLLVDPDVMDWPNIGRHELGAPSVNGPKAPELARQIEKAYPHLGEVTWRRQRVGPTARKLIQELASYDLIISTMGNWAGESFLNDVQQCSEGYPPILYGWVEANAAAAHAVLTVEGGACLRCGMDDKGRPNLRVTHWTEGSDGYQAPACGAFFTPYGPVELCWAHAFLAQAAIDALMGEFTTAFHRTWIGSRNRIELAGGTWTSEWLVEMGDPGNGSITVSRSWPASNSCPVCIRRVNTA